jgi:hypothetical protein
MSTFVNTDDISSLYSYEPALKNLYKIKITGQEKDVENLGWSSGKETLLHAVSVDLPSDSLKLERNSVTKNFSLGDKGGYTWNDTLTIGWRETRDGTVRKMHQAWIDLFYDKAKDQYISAKNSGERQNRYKKFEITLPNGDIVVCEDVIPQNQWNLSLAWSNSPELITYTIVYNVGYWYWDSQGATTGNSKSTTARKS